MAKTIFRIIDGLVNIVIVGFCILFLLYGGYGIWDSMQIYRQAQANQYEEYKPKGAKPSLEELHQKNPDVFGWITIPNTNIDYPLVQGEDNTKYVNTDVLGNFSLSGSLFLDASNAKDFSDFNNIIYGHHMEKNAMFGELAHFEHEDYFNKHPKGSLYYEKEWHPIEFVAFMHIDAYDDVIYNTEIASKEERDNYCSYVKEHALQYRELPEQEHMRYVVLSTCTSESTNGRHVLIGRWKERGEVK